MFEQTETARKPYSMLLSLILQILAIGALCLLPFAFPNALPTMRLKTLVLAAPKPPAMARTVASNTRTTAAVLPPRSFILIHGPLLIKPASVGAPASELSAPGLDGLDSGTGAPYGVGTPLPEPLPSAPAVAKSSPAPQKPVRVGTIAAANLIRMIQPLYPQIARVNHIQGTVEFTATISKQGTIEHLVLLRGHPLLVQAATDAVLQWRYRPTVLNGQAVEVITDIVVNFTLNQ